MAELPDDTLGVYLAVQRPCNVTLEGKPACQRDWAPDLHCEGCQGNGTRKLHTEVEVERTPWVIASTPDVRLWREVPRG